MIPPPITSSRFGTPPSASAPVESMTRGSSLRDERQRHRFGAGGDDRLFEADGLDRAIVRGHRYLVHRGEPAGAAYHLNLALLGQTREAAGEPLDDALFPVTQLVEIDLRVGEGEPVGGHLLRLGDHFRGVQQRLGRNAADVETDTAEPLAAVDQHDALAEIGGAERGAVSAGPSAEHQYLGVYVAVLGHRWPSDRRWCRRGGLFGGGRCFTSCAASRWGARRRRCRRRSP